MRQNKGQKNNIGICKLCLQESELRNSHIIPEFLYKPTYDDKHRANDINIDASTVRFAQKGLRERLLCGVCEGHLNVLETYFADTWYDRNATPKRLNYYGSETLSVKVNYADFKLFHLSVLWRASVSTLPYFSRVDLGPYEEGIRQMVLTLDPGRKAQYGIERWVSLDDKKNVVHGVVHFPRKVSSGLYTTYMCIFGGCRWLYFVARPDIKTPNWLKHDGALTLFFEMFNASTDIVAIGETLKKQPNASLYVDDVI